ncbi:thiamine phosphate synthase [Helicobacter canis]|uniref:Glycosyltransferase n=1 Tax=Helicobacter canis TaxID=29419 RepID=A0A377J4F4_9HELI|nr:thiamine phosphate synthase [Helicobacter canis]STO97185.1 glycosyltransferase [Helicobacter canis]
MRYNKAGKEIIAITDSRICKGDLLERIELLAQSGVKAIILREKQLEASAYRALAKQALAICARAGAACILHSFIEVARELGVSALHCQSSQIAHLPRLRREFATLGVSVHSVEEYKAAREWVDYVIIGHIFASSCKVGVEARGLKLLESIIAIAKDSVLGSHSGDFKDFRGTADLLSSSPLKSLKSTASTTATPRILEEKQAECEKVDSRKKAENVDKLPNDQAEVVFDKKAAGGRIFDEKAGLCSGEQGDKTCGLSTQRATNSPLFRKKPTPKQSPALQGLYAIGGITLETLPALANMPISGVCMRQALMQAPNPKAYIKNAITLGKSAYILHKM